ncbi:MAG: UDP-N-acetylmuramate dehydrogenase [Candidatus Spechtbacteria bacterium]|nr:UDP-N-acetylmuramate dehydrogenase [Candidatus Spechtbacteria bacterium]
MDASIPSGMKQNVKLARYTTYKIGGPARYFVAAKSEQEIAEAVLWAGKEGVPYFILGGGSNILVSDKGFDGLVIKIKNLKFEIKNFIVEAEAGVDLPFLVAETISHGLKGIEWASGIPGTFGGAIRGNAGAFGGEIKDILVSCRFLDEKGNVRTFSNKECGFSYRNSIFKQHPDYVILSATLAFEEGDKETLKKFSKDTMSYRAARHPLEYGSCGSIFKAIDVNDIRISNFEHYPRFRTSIKADPFPVVPAACFIDEAGLKGYRIGGAMVSGKHPNFFVNYKRARAEDVLMLINVARHRLIDTFGVMTEEEVQYVGF